MLKRFLIIFILAITLTACGSGGTTFTIKVINSENGDPLIKLAFSSYQLLLSMRNLGAMQVADGTGFCKDVGGVIGTSTGVPAAPSAGDIFTVSFVDCVDENDITYNFDITVEIIDFTDWDNLQFRLAFTSLEAASDWFDGTVTLHESTGTLNYIVAGNLGSILFETPGGTELLKVIATSGLAWLELDSLEIVRTEDAANAAVIDTTVTGAGRIYTTDIGPLDITLETGPVIKEDTSNPALLCPSTGRLMVKTDEDGSFAFLEYIEFKENSYLYGTNLSGTEEACT